MTYEWTVSFDLIFLRVIAVHRHDNVKNESTNDNLFQII